MAKIFKYEEIKKVREDWGKENPDCEINLYREDNRALLVTKHPDGKYEAKYWLVED